MLTNGFVSISREINEWELYGDYRALAVFCRLATTSNFTTGNVRGLNVEAGERVICLEEFAKEMGMPKSTLLDVLKRLERHGITDRKPASNFTIIKLKKYLVISQPDRNPTTIRPQPDLSPTRYNKDNKDNIINNKEDIIGKKTQKRFLPPTLEDVRSYCLERKNNVDPERFIDYYTANGWMVGKSKMKDWKAAVRTWEKNGFGNGSGKHDMSEGGKWCVYEGDVSWDDVFD